MKDFERREMILMRLYDLRETGEQYLTENNPPLVSELSLNDTPRICADLHELGHVEARSLHRNSSTRSREYDFGIVKISANGVDAVEGNESNKIKLMQSNNISVSNSSNVVVGDNNQITINRHISELENFIDCSSGTPEQKAEAKGLLRRFAEHPLLAAVISGAIGTFASKL